MKVYFLTHEVPVCRMMARRLADEGYECFVDDDAMGFYDNMLTNEIDYDMLVCDFRIFQMSVFNVYDFLQHRQTVLPVVFYNDPFPTPEQRVVYWIMQNERLYERPQLEYLIPVLEKLNDIIEDPSIHPYISLLQPPLPLPGRELEDGSAGRQIDVRLFRKRNRLQPGLFKLFKIFYDNQQHELSLKELSRRMWGTPSRSATVYSYISRLRRCIQNDDLVSIDIMRTAPGCYEMTVY